MYCYLLSSDNRTYIGATIDVERRLLQHNGTLAGGAKATRGRTWRRVAYISGFPDWKSTLSFEWAWKYATRRKRGYLAKLLEIQELLKKTAPTSKCLPYIQWKFPLFLHISADFAGVVEKIEMTNGLSVNGGVARSQVSFKLSYFPNFPSIPTMASVSDFNVLKMAFEKMSAEFTALKASVDSAVKVMNSGGAVSAEKADVKAAKKTRKPREKKPKKTCPAAEEGVIRFYSTAGKSDYKAFSNLFRSDFTVGEKTYPSVESYFQSAKFATTDPEYAEAIRSKTNPALTRIMGNSKKHPVREDWETVKVEVMRAALLAKFTSNEALKNKLIATDDALLEEESLDTFWGIGEDGTGQNMTGKLLMEVRKTLMEDDDEAAESDAESEAAESETE